MQAVFEWSGKRPDLLVWSNVAETDGWWWVELENTRRNTKELTRIDDWLRHAIYPQSAQNYPLLMGTSADVPMLGVVMLFTTEVELVDLRTRMTTTIEKWIFGHSRTRDIDFLVAKNSTTEFLQNFVHFVLLDDFSKWLTMESVDLY